MNTPLKLAAFGLGLVAVFGAAVGIGSAVGPVGPAVQSSAGAHGMDTGPDAGGHDDVATHATGLPAGLAVSERGYTLELAERSLPAGPATPVDFRITGPDGHPVTELDVDHDVELHLIAVRRDLTGFQHVHPRSDRTGSGGSRSRSSRVPGGCSPTSSRALSARS
jgi:hypothetical protein